MQAKKSKGATPHFHRYAGTARGRRDHSRERARYAGNLEGFVRPCGLTTCSKLWVYRLAIWEANKSTSGGKVSRGAEDTTTAHNTLHILRAYIGEAGLSVGHRPAPPVAQIGWQDQRCARLIFTKRGGYGLLLALDSRLGKGRLAARPRWDPSSACRTCKQDRGRGPPP